MSREQSKPRLFDQANVLSKLTFWWLHRLASRDCQHVAQTCSTFDVPSSDEADLLEKRLDGQWRKELERYSNGNTASLLRAILLTFLVQWLVPGLFLLLAETARVAQPVLLGMLIGHITKELPVEETTAYLCGFGLGSLLFLHMALSTVYVFLQHHVALKMKTGLEALIYQKIISLSSEAALQTSATMVTEQLSIDASIFSGALEHMHAVLVVPVEIGFLIYLLYLEVGVVGLYILVFVVGVSVLQSVLEVGSSKLREESSFLTEERSRVTEKVLSALLQAKLLCLEKSLTHFITSLRSKEISHLRGYAILQGLLYCILGSVSRLTLLMVILVAVNTNYYLSLRSVFTALALLDVLSWCLYQFPVRCIMDLLRLSTILEKVKVFLLLDEEKEQIKKLRLYRKVSCRNEPFADWAIDVDHMTARWPLVYTTERKTHRKRRVRDSTSSTKSLLHESDMEHAFSLKYLSLQVKKGELLTVVGSPNCGKTSLLMTLLGELPYEIGQISVSGRLSFSPQHPWVFSGTLRDNITFGNAYDEGRYQAVIQSCLLSKLLQLLPEGDLTVIGKHGLHLSMGYQAKITFARAVYHNADIYLLDDILSSFGSQTRQDIFSRCVCGMLQSKTRILVTNNPQHLKAADRIVVLREGSLFDVGSYEELQGRGIDMREFVNSDQKQNFHRVEIEEEEEDFHFKLKTWDEKNKILEQTNGACLQSNVHTFLGFLNGRIVHVMLPLAVLLWLAGQALSSASDWILSSWVERQIPSLEVVTTVSMEDLPSPPSLVKQDSTVTEGFAYSSRSGLLCMYTILLGVGMGSTLVFMATVTQLCETCCGFVHSRMLMALLGAKIRLCSLDDAAGTLSLFTRQLAFIDNHVPYLTCLTAETCLRVLVPVVLMCAVNPWLVLAVVPLLVCMVILHVFGGCMLQAYQNLKFSGTELVLVNGIETLEGLQTIRAFKREELFMSRFISDLNQLTWVNFLRVCTRCCLSLYSAFIVVVYASIVIYVSVFITGSMSSGPLVLSLAYCVMLILPTQFFIKQSTELCSHVSSVGKAMSVVKLEQEPPWYSDRPPPDGWPNQGSITFSGICLLSGAQGLCLLKDLSAHIKSKEKVGIVGEPGCWKNSLVTALMRFGHIQSGLIFIDGFDILKIGLHELRKNIAVISKEPVLFPGTLRQNLDPNNMFTDDQIWQALDCVELRGKIKEIQEGLEAAVGTDPCPLNLGQRQLLYLARALLKQNRVVVLEEAVGSIDTRVGDQIQRVLRARFRECTVVILTHHLVSVMDCDRVMVFSERRLVEFDTPYTLLRMERGHFTRLVEQTGKRQARHLRDLAELSHQQRASASLMLEHAVYMATEQLQASMEDLSSGNSFCPGSLAWSHIAKLSQSQDSLEKAHSDWGSHGDVREEHSGQGTPESPTKRLPQSTLAPSQKIINRRRMNPQRARWQGEESQVKDWGEEQSRDLSKKTDGQGEAEQVPLLNYGAPPKAPARNHNNANSFIAADSGDSSPIVAYKASPKPRLKHLLEKTMENHRPMDGRTKASAAEMLETNLSTPPSARRNYSPLPPCKEADPPPASQVQPRAAKIEIPGEARNRQRQRSQPQPRLQAEERTATANESARGRTEDAEKIIYC